MGYHFIILRPVYSSWIIVCGICIWLSLFVSPDFFAAAMIHEQLTMNF